MAPDEDALAPQPRRLVTQQPLEQRIRDHPRARPLLRWLDGLHCGGIDPVAVNTDREGDVRAAGIRDCVRDPQLRLLPGGDHHIGRRRLAVGADDTGAHSRRLIGTVVHADCEHIASVLIGIGRDTPAADDMHGDVVCGRSEERPARVLGLREATCGGMPGSELLCLAGPPLAAEVDAPDLARLWLRRQCGEGDLELAYPTVGKTRAARRRAGGELTVCAQRGMEPVPDDPVRIDDPVV